VKCSTMAHWHMRVRNAWNTAIGKWPWRDSLRSLVIRRLCGCGSTNCKIEEGGKWEKSEMVALDLSRTIKDGLGGCLIGAEGGVGYRSSVVRSQKNASVSNREIKSSLDVRRLLWIDKGSETGKINSTQNPCHGGFLTSLAFLDDDYGCKVGSGLGSRLEYRKPRTGARKKTYGWRKKNIYKL